MITKYVVIFENRKVEWLLLDDAQNYFNQNPDAIRIDTVQEPEPLPIIDSEEIPTWRLKAIVQLMGLKPQIDAIIQSLPEPDKTVAYNAWEYGNTTSRTSPFVIGIQQSLGLSDEQVNNIFQEAKNINV